MNDSFESYSEIVKINVSFHKSDDRANVIKYLNTLSKQVKENNSKLSVLNPLFIGINYGKISTSDDFTKVSLDKCELIYREGVYVKNKYLLCSIYKYYDFEHNENQIKILAFDNEKGTESIIDLEYKDLLALTDSNVNIINANSDLATYLINNLVYFKDSRGEEYLVCECRLYFEDYQDQKFEAKIMSDSINKQLLAKHKKSANFLHVDIATETELEWNVIHEAFDVTFEHRVYAYN